MPVIVIGADTSHGESIVAALTGRPGEIRAFVTDRGSAERLRASGVKVAIGDVSDGSHVGAAAIGCFSAVLVPEAARDVRERSFSSSPTATVAIWIEALAGAAVHRLLWLEDAAAVEWSNRIDRLFPESASIGTAGRTPPQVAAEVARIDDLAALDGA